VNVLLQFELERVLLLLYLWKYVDDYTGLSVHYVYTELYIDVRV